jgi:hypothetical protein
MLNDKLCTATAAVNDYAAVLTCAGHHAVSQPHQRCLSYDAAASASGLLHLAALGCVCSSSLPATAVC